MTILGVGALGAYTTFSSFARDAVALAERRHFAQFALYVGTSCGLAAVAAATAGIAVSGAEMVSTRPTSRSGAANRR